MSSKSIGLHSPSWSAQRLYRSLLFALLLWPLLAQAAARATLDRNQVQLGETVTLNVRIDGTSRAAAPDFTGLTRDFSILNSSTHSSFAIVNGAARAQLTYGVALRPKHIGTLTIPSMNIAGDNTAPLQLEVTAPDPQAAVDAGKDVFIEATTDTTQVYVGQQLLFTVRLYFSGSLSSGALEDPHVPGVDTRRLGDDADYQTQRGGRTYNVLERRYALIAQQVGRLDIPSINFQGESADPNAPNSFFFDGGTPVAVQSAPLRVEVRPVPSDQTQARWLPARKLELSLDGAPAGDQLRVGQSLNLTMDLRATGLPYEALPQLSLPSIDGATVYPDKPATRTRSDGQWLLGERQQGFAIVPDRPGTLIVPETTLQWFNVLTGKPETARIPAQQFNVAGTPGTPAGAPPASTASTASAPIAAAPVAHVPWGAIGFAIGSVVLGLLSVLGWLLWRRRRIAVAVSSPVAPAPPSHREARAAFMRVAAANDAATQAQCLLAWARTERPALQHLGELSAQLDTDAQRTAIAALQQRLYAPARGANAAAADLASAFKHGFAWRARAATADDEPLLPPLYPALDRSEHP